MARQWLRIAHRGASGHAPEHTRPAFERALLDRVHMIEIDVQLSRDGALVVIHDPTLERTTSGHGAVREQDFLRLKSLDAGSWFGAAFAGERVLSLDEVIDIVGRRARLNVEVKAPREDWPALSTGLIRTLRHRDLIESTVVSCFEMDALQAVRERDAYVRIGLLWQDPQFAEAWRCARDLRATSIHPYWMLCVPAVVQEARTRGLQVFAWTVNDVDAMRALLQQGVDGIMSDFPDRFGALGESSFSAA